MDTYLINNSARFAEPEEIMNAGFHIDCAEKKIAAGGPVLYSDRTEAWLCTEDSHSIAFGATGSKKTRLYIAPMIAALSKAGESMIINDPKGELANRFSEYLKSIGYKVIILNFRNPSCGDRWNPLKIPGELFAEGDEDKSDTYFRDIADSLYSEMTETTSDAYWPSTAKSYFTGVAQCVRKETKGKGLNMENIRLCSMEGGSGREHRRRFHDYLNYVDASTSMAMNIRETADLPDSTYACVMSVFSTPMNLYCSGELREMMYDSDFDMREVGKKKTAVFLITPAERASFNPIITAFVKQSYSVLIDLVASRQADGRLPVRVNYVLDEFSNLPAIPDFNNMISMSRGSNIRFHLVVQSVDQLYSHYSDQEAVNIMNNCDLWYVLRNKDTRLHAILQNLCGSRVSSYQRLASPLVTPMMIQKLDKSRGEMLVLYSGLDPFIGCYPDIDEYEFGLPAPVPAVFEKRASVNRDLFSLENVIKDYRQAELRKSMQNPRKSDAHSPFDWT